MMSMTVSFAFQFVREPLVITLLALFAGISVGVGHERGRARALWGLGGSRFPHVHLCSRPGAGSDTRAVRLAVGFAATALLRDRMAPRRRERDQES
ncbi:hypothetical protein HR12_02285 [Microbacterium sp. SUBG005]|nr:hypothetical protein HR12_02285 [Microbacterium sp. SUBG005]